MSKLKEQEDESVNQSNSMQTQASAQVTQGMGAANREADKAVDQVKTALEPLMQFLHDCKEGAIEGRGESVGEKVCSAATNALGAEGARLLGEGASDIVNGNVKEGAEKCAAAAAVLAMKYVELRSGSEAGTLYRDLAGQIAREETLVWVRDKTDR